MVTQYRVAQCNILLSVRIVVLLCLMTQVVELEPMSVKYELNAQP